MAFFHLSGGSIQCEANSFSPEPLLKNQDLSFFKTLCRIYSQQFPRPKTMNHSPCVTIDAKAYFALHLFVCCNHVSFNSRDRLAVRARLPTNAFLWKRLDINDLGRELLLGGSLILAEEWECQNLSDRVVIGDELEVRMSAPATPKNTATMWSSIKALPWQVGQCRDPIHRLAALLIAVSFTDRKPECSDRSKPTSILESVEEAFVNELPTASR